VGLSIVQQPTAAPGHPDWDGQARMPDGPAHGGPQIEIFTHSSAAYLLLRRAS
jgi:hypothetical protein